MHKEDGRAISPQYLNDIEYDRRNPPGEYLLRHPASVLSLPLDFLLFKAGRWPEDLREKDIRPEEFEKSFRAFRRDLDRDNRGNEDGMDAWVCP